MKVWNSVFVETSTLMAVRRVFLAIFCVHFDCIDVLADVEFSDITTIGGSLLFFAGADCVCGVSSPISIGVP